MDNKKLLMIAGGLFFIVLIVILMVIFSGGPGGGESAVLEFWGVFDDKSFYADTIQRYEIDNPNIRIVYRKFAFEDYEGALVSALAAGNGPDIFMMHNTWLPKHIDKITPLPQEKLRGEKEPLFTFRRFREEFVDVATQDLTTDGEIYALPLYVDTLALYFNRDVFDTEGIASPPRTWDDFNGVVGRLTQFDNLNNITRSAVAMGTARNINRSTDILTLLMLQSGVEMVDDDFTEATFARSVQGQNVGEIALQYYTDFANPTKRVYTWNDDQFYSIDAFFTGKTAMMFNYSHHIQTLEEKSARFKFGVALMPQIEGSEAVNYANYWAPTVAERSLYSVEAWKFLVYLASREGVTSYINASSRPVARRDLISALVDDPNYGIFAEQALSATSWLQPDSSAVETIFADMIDDVNFNRVESVREALNDAETEVNVLMQRR